MADIKWIKIATDIFDDEKILLIESMPDADALIVIWLKLLVLAGKCNDRGCLLMNDMVPYSEEMLSAIFRRPLNTIRLAISTFEEFGMVEVINNVITIPKWEKHQAIEGMEKVREQTRERVRRHRERQKLLASDSNVTVTGSNAREQDKDKELRKGCYDMMEHLNADEINLLYKTYENAGVLIDLVEEEINKKKRRVKDAYAYIVGYAENKSWATK